MTNPSLARLIQERDLYATDVGEVDRILALPIAGPVTQEIADDVSREVLSAQSWEDGFRLWPTQAAALLAYALLDGAFCKVGVGWGKGGISMLISEHAYRHKGTDKIVLLVPASMVGETVSTVYPMWQKQAGVALPLIPLAGQSRTTRERWARSGKAGLYLLSYSVLSRSGGLELLSAISPGLIVADEAHHLKDPDSGLTKKFLYFMKHAPKLPRFVAMSGTMTAKSLLDYHHLISLSLGARSPLPLSRTVLEQWATLLDSSVEEITPDHFVDPLLPILRWAQVFVPSGGPYDQSLVGLRNAFSARLTSAPGVVSTSGQEIPNSLEIREWPCPVDELAPDILQVRAFMDQVESGKTPDGDEIPFAIHRYKWLSQLAHGFYISLQWPQADKLAERYGWELATAEKALALALDHHAMSQALAKELRAFLQSYHHPIATPFEAYGLIETHPERIPKSIRDYYSACRNAEAHSKRTYGRLVERDSKFIRVSSFKVDAATAWAKEHKVGLIWIWHRGLAVWCLEELRRAGLDPVDAKRGEHELIRNVGDPKAGGKGDRLCVVSTGSHYQGKNLQAFSTNLFFEWPRPAKLAEQAIGRTHRNGQDADIVLAYVMRPFAFDDIQFAATLNDAVYIQTTMKDRQKILFASHTTSPKLFSSEFLASRGAEPQILTPAMQKELARRFGRE